MIRRVINLAVLAGHDALRAWAAEVGGGMNPFAIVAARFRRQTLLAALQDAAVVAMAAPLAPLDAVERLAQIDGPLENDSAVLIADLGVLDLCFDDALGFDAYLGQSFVGRVFVFR